MPWRKHPSGYRPLLLGLMTGVLLVLGVITLLIAYALPPCSLEAAPLLRELHQCR